MRHRNRILGNFQFLFITWIATVHIFFAINARWTWANSAEDAGITTEKPPMSESFGWSSGGPYGGYVYRLATAPSDANIIYAGTDDGVYMSVDTGESWRPAGLSRQRIRVVAVNPQDARTIYAGTDGGIQKSVNGGTTWAAIGPFENSTATAHRILDLAINSQNPSIVYAVTESGATNFDRYYHVAKSTDGGNSWQTKFTKKYSTRIISILIDTDNPNRLYVGVDEWGIALYISTDGGDAWTAKSLIGIAYNWQTVVALAMTPAGSNPARIYGLDSHYGVFASDDRGATWTNTSVPYLHINGPWALKVDPTDPSAVYVGTQRWNLDNKNYEGLLHKSANAGGTWVTHTLAGLATDFTFSSSRQLCAGFDNGVQRSSDRGATWQRSGRGMAITPIAGLAVDPLSAKVYAVINEQSNATLAKHNSYPAAVSADQGSTWSYLDGGPKNHSAVAVAPGSPSTLWTGDGYKTDTAFYVHKSIDGGSSWSRIYFLQITGGGEATLGASDILVNSRNSNCVLVGFQHVIGTGILGRTTDGGLTWAKLGESTSALAADPNDPDLVYRGRAMAGGVWAISNVCGTWNSVYISSNIDIGDVNDIEVGSDSRVYVAATNGLWRWDKSNWVKLVGPPKGTPTALAIDREITPDILYVGTSEEGVYSSVDGGLTWKTLNNGLVNLRVKKLAIGTGANKMLYAGTAGGVWRTNLEGGPPTTSIGVFRPSIGMWFLDRSGNGSWNDCVTDKCINFGIQEDIPVTGDWNGDGATKIGVFRPSIGWWFLDYNGNGQWDGCTTDRCYNFGISDDTPVTGDWDGDGATEIGVFRPSIGWWFLDYNGDGTWSGCSADRCYNLGISEDRPVTGDWNGDGKTEIGVFRPSIGWWFVDVNGNGTWNGCSIDGCYNFGIAEDLPVTGDWNGDGFAEIGVFRSSTGWWFLDYNGNDTWNDCTTDRCYQFGISVDTPVTGSF